MWVLLWTPNRDNFRFRLGKTNTSHFRGDIDHLVILGVEVFDIRSHGDILDDSSAHKVDILLGSLGLLGLSISSSGKEPSPGTVSIIIRKKRTQEASPGTL